MKKTWFYTLSICFLILAQVVTAYAQEAKAYATVLIIIPERPQQAAQVTETAKEDTSQERSRQEEITLASAQTELSKEDSDNAAKE